MKLYKRILLIIVLVTIPLMANAQDKTKKTEIVTFTTSIDCQSCVNNIMNNLPRGKGVKDVKCDLKTKEVIVKYLVDKTDTITLQRSIEKLGYTAKPVKEVQPDKKKEK